jgi:hypothetical protein
MQCRMIGLGAGKNPSPDYTRGHIVATSRHGEAARAGWSFHSNTFLIRMDIHELAFLDLGSAVRMGVLRLSRDPCHMVARACACPRQSGSPSDRLRRDRGL